MYYVIGICCDRHQLWNFKTARIPNSVTPPLLLVKSIIGLQIHIYWEGGDEEWESPVEDVLERFDLHVSTLRSITEENLFQKLPSEAAVILQIMCMQRQAAIVPIDW